MVDGFLDCCRCGDGFTGRCNVYQTMIGLLRMVHAEEKLQPISLVPELRSSMTESGTLLTTELGTTDLHLEISRTMEWVRG